ncbi:bacteriohemerythrin [Amphritea pacifica]|uniref:Hemerythrin family protein n=1 Tax=Amphritea pacifica TaxID=2811233 RepID=A0ABS2W2S4_9GAMM|nr:hemerythrin family protein [Amphritea pacifica]MBN0986003.1 hemerythrin family protein [Amphritea pacifica]
MTLLKPEQIPTVGLDFMNHDHAAAAEQINTLYRLLRQARAGDKASEQQIEPLLTDMYAHSQSHFAREEAEMIRAGFPAYSCHKDEHERVLEELTQVLLQWQKDQHIERLEDYLNTTLCDWLINHISTMDTVTAMFVGRYNHSVA